MTFTAWTSKLAFGPWWLLRSGPIGPTEAHAHRAFQVVVHGGAPCIADGDGEPVPGPVAVIPPEQMHAIHSHRDHALVVYVEPDSAVGHLLRDQTGGASSELGRGHPMAEILGSLLPTNWSRADEAVRSTLAYLGVPPPSKAMLWWRHPTFDETLTKLAGSAVDGTADLAEAATVIGVPPSRLEEVFPAAVGIPLRAYARWLRLIRATEHLVDGLPIEDAAHAAHFTDGAHLEHSVKEMFGLAATELAWAGEWIR